MGGVQMRKLMRTRVVVVFGATSRVGKATTELLCRRYEGVTVVVAVERPKEPRIKRLRRATGCYAVQCDYTNQASMQRVVRNADAVLLVPALSPSGTRFSKLVLDACVAEDVPRIVLISSLLATDDFWRQGNANGSSYEAIEAHARDLTNNCIALRIPLLMETILYCRDEVMFANRFFTCFQPTTPVPCIAVSDVALAASHVLTASSQTKFHATYSLANNHVTCSPLEIEKLLSETLGRSITAKYISPDKLTQLLKDKGVSELVAGNMVRMKQFVEMSMDMTSHSALQTQPTLVHAAARQGGGERGGGEEGGRGRGAPVKAPLPLTRVGFSNDFQTLTQRALTSPREWLRTASVYFQRSAENQMQLFVMGSGEGLFQEVERLVAQQVTAPMAWAATGTNGEEEEEEEEEGERVGEAAIPTVTGAAVHSKATFCTIKTVPGGRQRQHFVGGGAGGGVAGTGTGGEASAMLQLLAQLTPADVVLFVPPLRFGAAECMEVLRVTVDAVRQASAWGIVTVGSIFTGHGWSESSNRMAEMEQFLEHSDVPYAVVRLPLLMEYFLALSAMPPPPTGTVSPLDEAEEEQPEPEPETHPRTKGTRSSTSSQRSTTPGTAATAWPLLGRALATTPQYLISTADAAKALVAVAYTFPLHRNKIRSVFTERRTMLEIEGVLQKYAYKGTRIDFSKVDALMEKPGHEFWRIAYWPKSYVKQFLETSVALSGGPSASAVAGEGGGGVVTTITNATVEDEHTAEIFQEITECPSVTLEKWAARYTKSYTHALGMDNHQRMKKKRKKAAIASTKPRPHYEDVQRGGGTNGADAAGGERATAPAELNPIQEEEKEEVGESSVAEATETH